MGFAYGIEICRNTLSKFASKNNFDNRLSDAFSEIGVIEEDDVSHHHFKEIKEWREKYLDLKASLRDDIDFKPENPEEDLEGLATKLVYICVEIIEYNSDVE